MIILLAIKGPSMGFSDSYPKRDMWKEIARSFDGEFKITHDISHTIENHEVVIPYKKWQIRISVSDTKPLKFAVAFASSQDFELSLSLEDFMEKIMKRFGKPEIELGWEEFDRQYLVKSNNSSLTRQILSKDIQKTLLKYNVYSLSFQTDSRTMEAEMISVIQKEAGNKEMILELIGSFKSLIDNLHKSGTIK